MRLGQANNAWREHFSASNFLRTFSPEMVGVFDSIKVTTTYPTGATLFVEGQESHGVFVLVSGRAKISMGSASGKVIILRIARPGEIMGLHAAVSHTFFQATAETIEPCQVSFVRRDDFLRFLHGYPQAALEAAKQLSASYQEACLQLRALGLCDSARKRVARFVLDWVETGEQREDGIRATLTLTHEEIGQLIGTSRETITRALGEFKNRRWIAIKGTSLLVKNFAALQKLAGDDMHSSWTSGVPEDSEVAGAYVTTRGSGSIGVKYP